MEKLQAAIEKARNARQRRGGAASGSTASEPVSGADPTARGRRETRPETRSPEIRQPATSPARPAVSGRPAGEPADQKVPGGPWERLCPMEITEKTIRNHRLVAYRSGPDAGPFDMLRTRILQQARSHDWTRVALISPEPGTGKSTLTANVAFSLGRRTDLRSLVFDLDLRRAGLSRNLAQSRGHSMADVLAGEIGFLAHGVRHGDNVAFGLNDGPVRNPSEILQSGRATEILDEIQNEFCPDIMLFDLPPLMASDEALGFLGNVDCALLLAEADKTTMEQIDVAERQLNELTNVMGVVLNKCRHASETYGDYG